jgi:ERCC4-type nuclease
MTAIVVTIDNRERDLYDAVLENPNEAILVTKNVLLIGDISITYNDVIICIIERKTIADLMSSITDGRYDEQSHRLKHSSQLHPHNIIYVIEGMSIPVGASKQIFYSSMVSLNYFKGFSVMRTQNVKETAQLLTYMALKLKLNIDDGKLPTWDREQSQSSIDYSTVVSQRKQSNITHDNIHNIMLCQIPSVSHVTSSAIMHKYKSIKLLTLALEADKHCLDDITSECKGKKRKISKKAVASIVQFLA